MKNFATIDFYFGLLCNDDEMKKPTEFIYDLVFPKKCAGCQAEGPWLCPECFEKIIIVKAAFCPFCQRITPQGQYCSRCRPRFNLTGVIIAANYENPLKDAIHKYKYDRIRELAEPLSELLVMRLEAGFPTGNLVLIPVPLTKERERERGFNQAEVLAKKLSQAFDLSLVTNVLRRTKNRPAQITLTGRERRENIKGVFEVKGDLVKIKGKTILLLDDVMTTGATLNEAAGVLKKAGARNIWGLVLAKG